MSNATDIRQSGGTAGSVDHTDTSLAVSRTIPVPPTDTLYRAALTFCLDGADVMMYATLKGAENAESLWHALAQSHPSQPSEICGPALSRIDLLIESGGLVMGPQGIGNRCDVTVDLGQRRIDGLSGATYSQSLLHH